MNALHLVFLLGRKSAEDTLATCKLLLESGLQKQINEPDSLGNTPLHGLIVRYAIEEARIAYDTEIPWNKWDVLHLVSTTNPFIFVGCFVLSELFTLKHQLSIEIYLSNHTSY